jgi:hypothetical protein
MPIMLSDVMLNAVMLSVVAPEIGEINFKENWHHEHISTRC